MSEQLNSAIVILGGSGDLARRKLVPALSRLFDRGEIDNTSLIVGSGRSEFDDDSFRARFEVSSRFAAILCYHKGIPGLREYLRSKGNFRRVVFFMALPPAVYASTAKQLVAEGFGAETTLIIEKPFGYDYSSAKKLNDEILSCFDESQIYRIDHYLAKEAVQNILVFRFANPVFYPVWNSRYVESIQISASELIGTEHRGAYFDGAGIVRDMVQNHLMQLLCLMTMEAPISLHAEDIRSQKINVLKAMEVIECRRFQYKGYRDEEGVATGSNTETYAELKLKIDDFRWTGTPIYIRTGKGLARKGTEIGIRFKPLPKLLFNKRGAVQPNKIIFKIQPSEGIVLDLASKTPGDSVRITNTSMKFCYRDSFHDPVPEAYQKLLLDALRCDRTLFVSAEETELSWKNFGSFLDQGTPELYEKGANPPSCLGADWIDFGQYDSVCG